MFGQDENEGQSVTTKIYYFIKEDVIEQQKQDEQSYLDNNPGPLQSGVIKEKHTNAYAYLTAEHNYAKATSFKDTSYKREGEFLGNPLQPEEITEKHTNAYAYLIAEHNYARSSLKDYSCGRKGKVDGIKKKSALKGRKKPKEIKEKYTYLIEEDGYIKASSFEDTSYRRNEYVLGIKTKFTFTEIPREIFLGRTVNGKMIVARVRTETQNLNTAPTNQAVGEDIQMVLYEEHEHNVQDPCQSRRRRAGPSRDAGRPRKELKTQGKRISTRKE